MVDVYVNVNCECYSSPLSKTMVMTLGWSPGVMVPCGDNSRQVLWLTRTEKYPKEYKIADCVYQPVSDHALPELTIRGDPS
jgi:hypothetical protein